VTWARGDTSRGRTVSSIQSFAVSGTRPEPVVHRGTALGFVYEDGHARYCRLGGVLPARPGAARDAQAREVFDTLAAALREAGFLFTDTVRTWFYLDRLLEWYAEFNAARTAFFEEHGVFDGIVPASTGIGAGNAAGAAVSADLLAVQPKGGAASVSAVPSPMQDSAMLYDSSFSRAVKIDWPDRRQLVVSGTAGIGRDGRTVRAGDPAGQIGVALDVVDALLRSRGMGWGDVTRGIAYFANLAHRPLFDACASERGAAGFPLAVAEAAICRPDLHFEIEVDAVRPVRRTRPGTRGPTPGTAPARGR
jgi:enamine deaminase RidA (YjgF/YER057c/UK114 family)